MQKVSVIIPTYNYGRFIGKAIESVLAQTVPIHEIIVVDDGSTDETGQTVKAFGEQVHYIKQQNGGVCAARNNGVKNSSGDYIAFLDADDEWLPEKIEKQLAKFETDAKIGLVFCGMREFDFETGETIGFFLEGEEGWVADDLILFEKPVVIVSGSAIMVTRQAFDEVGGFDPKLKNGEDWEFCYRVARKFKVGFAAEILVNYCNHGVNAHLNIKEMERSTLIAWNKAFATKDKKILKLRKRAFGNLHKVLAGSYLHNGQYFDFTRHLFKSIWFRPAYLGYYFSLSLRRWRKSS